MTVSCVSLVKTPRRSMARHTFFALARADEFDSRPKPFAANLDDGGMVDVGERAEQGFPQDAAPQGEFLVLENVDRLARDRRGKRIAAKGRAMAAGIENVHDGAPRDKRGDGHQAAAECLANDETVWLGVLVFKTEISPVRPSLTGPRRKSTICRAGRRSPEACQISPGWHDNSRLALNGLDENGDREWRDRRLKRPRVAEWHRDKAGRERPKPRR